MFSTSTQNTLTKAPEGAVFKNPYYVQRMRMKNKDNQVKFSDRFELDYMGATEFEIGDLARRIRELNENCEVGEVVVAGQPVFAAWNPKYFNREGVAHVLNLLHEGSLRTKEFIRFDVHSYAEWKEDSKRQSKDRHDLTDSWFDIQHGLFWTWKKCNIGDLRLNFRKSVAFMDARKAEQVKG